MITPIEIPIFIRGMAPNHPGLDVIPSGTGHWGGMPLDEFEARNNIRLNTDILAVWGGVIDFVGNVQGAGFTVVLNTGIYRFVYAHLSKVFVSVGQVVDMGEPLGKMGNTGMNDPENLNIHLHLTVQENYNGDDLFRQNVVDPMMFFRTGWSDKDKATILFVREEWA